MFSIRNTKLKERRREPMEGLKITLIALAGVLAVSSANAANPNNEAMKTCLDKVGYDRNAPVENRFEGIDIRAAAKCYQDYKQNVMAVQMANLREFLKANPRYRVPGQSQNSCWGKPRESAFESVSGTAGAWGYDISVNYKDTLPAGCYENGSWDNREGHPNDYD
tara:strand:- start:645 stop:1139 length:495 start_codon:yes stop_codon:yes gene_type:complete